MLSDRCVLVREGESVVAGVREAAGAIEVSLRGDIDLASRTSMVEEVARLFGPGMRLWSRRSTSGAVEIPGRLWDQGVSGLRRMARAIGCDLAIHEITRTAW